MKKAPFFFYLTTSSKFTLTIIIISKLSFIISLFGEISKNPSLIIYADLKITTITKKVSSREREREREIRRQYCAKYIVKKEKEKYHSTFYLKTKSQNSEVQGRGSIHRTR